MQLTINGTQTQTSLSDGATIVELLASLDRNSLRVAVEVNLQLVPRDQHGQFRLANGDRVEVVSLVGGG